MNKTITFTIIFIVGIIGLMFWGRSIKNSAESDSGAKSALTAKEILYDFGTISMKDGEVTKEFTIANETLSDIYVPKLVTSCMCTNAFIVSPDVAAKGPFGMPGMGTFAPPNEIIKAGESRIIRVVYNPNAHGPSGVGQVDRFVTLTDKSGGNIIFEIKALVTP